jgi:glycosylphosphatidylinositol transamidase (GPIT) subunit GPI8
MASGRGLLLALSLALCAVSALGRAPSWDGKIVMPTNEEEEDKGEQGTRWAILIAGSAGYWNYRHQVPPHSTKIMPVVYHLLRLLNSSQR